MSSLWVKNETINKTIEYQRPSPTYDTYSKNNAQKRFPLINSIYFKQTHPIKRISLFTFPGNKASMSGSMSLEAAVILPLLLFFFFNLISLIEIFRLHGNLELALWETGNRIAVYSHAYREITELFLPQESLQEDGEDGNILNNLQGIALSYLYVKNQIIEYTGEDYLKRSPLAKGIDGLNFLESTFLKEDDCIDIIVTYQVSPLYPIPGYNPFRIANRYYARAWTGYEITETNDGTIASDYVYVTETGSVYHETTDCSHLRLTVQKVPKDNISNLRNEQNGHYYLCERCKEESNHAYVYITNFGTHYHYSSDCPGIKRTILSISRTAAASYRPCSRCAAGQQ